MMVDVLFVILWAACSLAVWVIYHKLFSVMYFNLFNGCLKEVIGAGLVGAVLAGMIIRFWYIAIVVVVLLVIAISKRS